MMSKRFINVNSIGLFFICLCAGISFSGCSTLSAKTSKDLENKEITGSKTEQTRSTSTAANTAASPNKEILWDFRKPEDIATPEFSKAETRAVVKYLFGDQASPELEIRSRVSGSFTKPDAHETLYFLSGCKDQESGRFVTDCPHVAWNTEGWIAIYDGTTPVMKIHEALGSAIIKVTDVNGDHINEIVSIGGYGGMGIDTLAISIGQISGNKYHDIKGFDGYADNCSGNFDDATAKAAVISYIPTSDGKMPVFTEEYFQGKCDENGLRDNPQWKKITKKQFQDFYDSLT